MIQYRFVLSNVNTFVLCLEHNTYTVKNGYLIEWDRTKLDGLIAIHSIESVPDGVIYVRSSDHVVHMYDDVLDIYTRLSDETGLPFTRYRIKNGEAELFMKPLEYGLSVGYRDSDQ